MAGVATVVVGGSRSPLGLALELAKIRITAMVSVTTAMGYVLFAGEVRPHLPAVVCGVLLLACGSAAFNHFQEREIDAKMTRTRRRPIPSGAVRPATALLYAAALITAGAGILAACATPTALVLGLVCLFWYNGVYTPLKRTTPFAVVPGSLIGALPPVIGWVAAGGSALDPRALALGAFFFIWQVPHFWLLLLVHGREYEKAGMPSLTSVLSTAQLSRLTFVWMATTALACLLLPLFGLVQHGWALAVLGLGSSWLVLASARLLSGSLRASLFRAAFFAINLYALLVILVLSVEGLLQ
ncbi:protoheme IX farnesyltransferase [bacterium]|nr:protoheme IX farnesyltransferase [bacterium]